MINNKVMPVVKLRTCEKGVFKSNTFFKLRDYLVNHSSSKRHFLSLCNYSNRLKLLKFSKCYIVYSGFPFSVIYALKMISLKIFSPS